MKFPVFNMEAMYRDYGPERISMPGFHFSGYYTPWGIKRLDSDYCKRIINLDGETSELLARRIHTDYHLHPTIRRNLLYNLRMRYGYNLKVRNKIVGLERARRTKERKSEVRDLLAQKDRIESRLKEINY